MPAIVDFPTGVAGLACNFLLVTPGVAGCARAPAFTGLEPIGDVGDGQIGGAGVRRGGRIGKATSQQAGRIEARACVRDSKRFMGYVIGRFPSQSVS